MFTMDKVLVEVKWDCLRRKNLFILHSLLKLRFS